MPDPAPRTRRTPSQAATASHRSPLGAELRGQFVPAGSEGQPTHLFDLVDQRLLQGDVFASFQRPPGRMEVRVVGSTDHDRVDALLHLVEHDAEIGEAPRAIPCVAKAFPARRSSTSHSATMVCPATALRLAAPCPPIPTTAMSSRSEGLAERAAAAWLTWKPIPNAATSRANERRDTFRIRGVPRGTIAPAMKPSFREPAGLLGHGTFEWYGHDASLEPGPG